MRQQDIIKKYVKLKGKIRVEWYDVIEDDEEEDEGDGEVDGDEEVTDGDEES